jgi:hypothetical protein
LAKRTPPLLLPLDEPVDQTIIVDKEGSYLDYSVANYLFALTQSVYDIIARGEVAGSSTWSKTGYNGNVGITEEDMWGGGNECNFPAAATGMFVYSTNANDTIAGTGIRSVNVTFLTAGGIQSTETVNMNGLSGVTLSNTPYRINHFRAALAGSGAKAAGDIYLMNTAGSRVVDAAGTSVYSIMATGYTRARNIQYTIPAGKKLHINSIGFSCGDKTTGKSVRFTTRARYDNLTGTSTTFFVAYHEKMLQDAAYDKYLVPDTVFPEMVDLKVSVISDTAGAICTCDLRGYLCDC